MSALPASPAGRPEFVEGRSFFLPRGKMKVAAFDKLRPIGFFWEPRA
jgi:hypothetical protein